MSDTPTGKVATGLAKNPLGIIALFIVLADAFASLVLGFQRNLSLGQQWLFSLFITLFPLVVLGIFLYLVTKHHKKLYAPTEFRSDESFLGVVTVQLGEGNSIDSSAYAESVGPARLNQPAASLPAVDVPKTENPHEVELPRISKASEWRLRSSLMARERIVNKDLVLRKIEAELNAAVRRQAAVLTATREIRLDGLIETKGAWGIIIVLPIASTRKRDALFQSCEKDIRDIKEHYKDQDSKPFFQLAITFEDSDRNIDGLELFARALSAITPQDRVRIKFYDLPLLRSEADLQPITTEPATATAAADQ